MRIFKIAYLTDLPDPFGKERIPAAARDVINNQKRIKDAADEHAVDPEALAREVYDLRRLNSLPVDKIQHLVKTVQSISPNKIALKLNLKPIDVAWVLRKTMPEEKFLALPEEKEEVLRLLDEGKSRKEISKLTMIDYFAVSNIVKVERGEKWTHSQSAAQAKESVLSEYSQLSSQGKNYGDAVDEILQKHPALKRVEVNRILSYRGIRDERVKERAPYKTATLEDIYNAIEIYNQNPNINFINLSKAVGHNYSTLRRAFKKLKPGWYESRYEKPAKEVEEITYSNPPTSTEPQSTPDIDSNPIFTEKPTEIEIDPTEKRRLAWERALKNRMTTEELIEYMDRPKVKSSSHFNFKQWLLKSAQFDEDEDEDDENEFLITKQDILDAVMEENLLAVLVAQYSGVFNPIIDAHEIIPMIGISTRAYKDIIKNYTRLVEMHPELKQEAARIVRSSKPKDNTTLEKMLWLKKLISKAKKKQ